MNFNYKYANTFTVEGTGTFPFDMLRYDRCFPLTEGDSARMRDTTLDYTAPAQVRMMRFTEGKGKNFNDVPTTERWASMGWKVSDIHWRKL